MASTRITGNDDAAGADPGGTRSTKPGVVKDNQRQVTEDVKSGDRNDRRESKIPAGFAKDK